MKCGKVLLNHPVWDENMHHPRNNRSSYSQGPSLDSTRVWSHDKSYAPLENYIEHEDINGMVANATRCTSVKFSKLH